MKIAIIGGGASGMVTAYLLDQQGHHVTVFEKQPMLGGHIRTLNKNVRPNHLDCEQVLENGVLEFPSAFHNFLALMKRLNVELEPVDIGSGLFFPDGHHILSGTMIRRNFTGLKRFLEYLRLDTLYARSAGFWVRMQFPKIQDFYDQSIGQHLGQDCERNAWLKLLTMYSYSTPYELIENFPAELAIPALRQYIFVKWFRIQGGVYSYIEKILEQFRGRIVLNAIVKNITRTSDGITLEFSENQQSFEKVVFATPPDQVIKLLADPTPAETRRFERWQPNYARTFLHADTSMYKPYGIAQPSEFDFFKTAQGWGYNAFLNQLCDIKSGQCYSLAFNMASLIDKNKIIHIQEHHTPLYTTESFHYRDQILETNGENNTYYAGAYLGDGLHEGAVTSAMQVAKLIQSPNLAKPPQHHKNYLAAPT
ncbi:FAD-dependent oxidoreductase [Leptolyngbya cf. ectocarpi LEGE 11479]|uniref:FAD-dependent oxidoreductase n=1 Tax=Leptolyngbya cf. ectocarpi LEGE 11479 TaxID=1828722 RepID=A0A928ZWE0_LEPEC|nr:FAD-dependent oxidoreductase [Leptolyngbya ectocarpi]MBE9068669.1 FAD-dependent oxidoreductase [Leptolyngbya cf. ectocarpi LEGE 11479]